MFLNPIIRYSILILLFSQACKKEDIPPVETLRPILVSSIPANGDMDVDVATSLIKLVFEEPVEVADQDLIKMNGESIVSSATSGDTLIVNVEPLSGEMPYELDLEAYSIKVVTGSVNAETISIAFTTGEAPVPEIDPNPAVKNPSKEVQNMYRFLVDNYGKKTISSTIANVSWNLNEAEWVKQHTDKYPAMATFDYIHLPFSPANWINYSQTGFIEDWWNENGLVSAGWHWIVPVTEGATEYSYKPSETTFKASNAIIDGTWENEVVNADLEKLANYLLLFKNKNIPVIWRPLHEAAGNIYEYPNGEAWFWWGYDGAGIYKKLWIYMFDFFQEKGLNNLLWVWTTQTKDADFYPGDEYVDIIGRDVYNTPGADAISAEYISIKETYPNKLVTMSEFGDVADIALQWESGAQWSYFMPWYDYKRTNDVNSDAFKETSHDFADADWWKNAMNSELVISRDKMPSLK